MTLFFTPVPLDGAGRFPEFFVRRGFHLDYFGAEVRHHHGGDASGHSSCEVKNCDPIEDLRHYSPPDLDLGQPDIRRGTVILIHKGLLGVNGLG